MDESTFEVPAFLFDKLKGLVLLQEYINKIPIDKSKYLYFFFKDIIFLCNDTYLI